MSTCALPDRSPGSRLLSLDAYRGFVMIALAANGFGLAQTAKNMLKDSPDSALWQTIHYQLEHVPWVGCGFWDLIQPSFMFMVGVALPYSAAKRLSAGDTYGQLLGHAVIRAFVLVLLGVFLTSNGKPQTDYAFMNVLTQIGLGYVFLFLLWDRPRWVQGLAAVALLGGYWAWFATYPLPSGDVDWTKFKMKSDWSYLAGFEAHWQIHVNAAADVDRWLLNFFPRPEPFVFNAGGYQTLNFIPSLATMLFGLMTGEFIRRTHCRKTAFVWLLGSGVFLLAAGLAISHYGYCPLVKRIWTPSWALFSTGWALILLAGFYGIIDGLGWKAWSFPLVVAGMNSIALYLMGQQLRGWVCKMAISEGKPPEFSGQLVTHFGAKWPLFMGEAWAPTVVACGVLLAFWLTTYWLYRQRIFFKI